MTEPSTETELPQLDASMHDMLRMMDVASALRRERETAEAQLDIERHKDKLRERLLATAAAAGESVSEAEVDTAIREYLRRQHTYADPPRSWRRLRAHAWVLRWRIFLAVALVGLFVAGAIWAGSMFAGDARDRANEPARRSRPRRQVPPPVSMPTRASTKPAPTNPAPTNPASSAPVGDPKNPARDRLLRTAAAAAAIASNDDARRRVAGLRALGEAAHAAGNAGELATVQGKLERLSARLGEEYEVRIVARPGEKSGIDRYVNGRLSGYYVLVEALGPDGRALQRSIKNIETGATERVRKWGELVPETVWQRLVADKRADGVMNETLFARKSLGEFDEVVVIKNGSRPLKRGGSITAW
ncbi:MAG: DUF6384 family protein [Planctomycetota bacterium]